MRALLAMAGLAGCLGLAGPAAAFTLQPHTATYEVRLARAGQASQIQDARGTVRIEWRETCQAWTASQRFQLGMAMVDGTVSEVLTEYMSVEAKDGRSYSFESKTLHNGQTVESYKGAVERTAPGAAGTVRYQDPAGQTLALPGGVVFPMQQMAALLTLAEKGGGQIDLSYFDGPRPEDSPFATHTVVSDRRREAAEGARRVTASPFDRPFWPMRMAFYGRGSQGAVPTFEIGAEVQDNGVARLMLFDYGDFAITATAVSGAAGERPRC